MEKIVLIIVFLFATFTTQANTPTDMPQSVYDQIVTQVIQDKGYLDTSAVQEAIAQWQLQQPLPATDGALVETGNCATCTADTQGTSAQFKKPRNVKVKAKKHANGKYPSVLKIKWTKPKKLAASIRDQYKISHYLIYISKDGQSYEILRKEAKYKKNGKLKKKQKIKFKDRTTGTYTVQVQAVYVPKTATAKSAQKSINKGASTGSISPWTSGSSFETQSKYTTVGQYTGAIHSCLNDNGFTDATLLTAVDPSIDCTGYNLQNADIDLMANLTNIRSIIIANNPAVTDISTLANLNYLEYLDLSNNPNIIQPDFSLFSELITLKLANMGLTTVPDLSTNDLLISLNLNDNPITTGFDLLPSTLEVLDAKSTASNPCDTIPPSKTIDSLTLSGTAITSIESCANVTGLRYLTINDAPNLAVMNNEVNVSIDSFAGFCGLTFNNTNLEILEGSRPINRLNLINNSNLQQLNTIKPAYDKGTTFYPDLIPASVRIQGSDSMDCGAIFQKKTLKETLPTLQMQGVSVFTKVNGIDKNSLMCPYTMQADFQIFPTQCKPDPVLTFQGYNSEDLTSILVWQPHNDILLWGVTYFEISVNDGGTIKTYNVDIASGNSLSLPKELGNTTQNVVYEIRACTINQCGYPKIINSTSFHAGINSVNASVEFVPTTPLNNFNINLRYIYPTDIVLESTPTRFEVSSLMNSYSETIQCGGACVSGVSYSSTLIEYTATIGSELQVQACNDYIGCGPKVSVDIRPVVTSADLPIPIWQNRDIDGNTRQYDALSGLYYYIIQPDPYHINWKLPTGNQNNVDVDYFEITEWQPVDFVDTGSSPRLKTVYYVDINSIPSPTSNGYFSYKLNRKAKGAYDYDIRACKRYRQDGQNDVCSEYAGGIVQMPNPNNPSQLINCYDARNGNQFCGSPQSSRLYLQAADFLYDPDSHLSNTDVLKDKPSAITSNMIGWNNVNGLYNIHMQGYEDTKADYFLIKQTNAAQHINNCNLGTGNAIIKISFADVDNPTGVWSTESYCSDLGASTVWEVKACTNGLSCSDPILVDLNTGTGGTNSILNPANQNTPQNAGGPGDFKPGMWWNPELSGTGWHFYWASELRFHSEFNNPANDELYSNTYDLIGYWLSYKQVKSIDANGNNRSVWTPTWYDVRLKYLDSGVPLDINGNAISGCFEGMINYNSLNQTATGKRHSKTNVGNLQVCFHEGTNTTATLIFAITDNNGIISQAGGTSNLGPYTISDDGRLILEIEDFSIDVIGNVNCQINCNDIQEQNNNDHYSGLWQHYSTDDFSTDYSDVSLLTWLESNLELSSLALYDTQGEPIWFQAVNCHGNNDCNPYNEGYFDNYKTGDSPDGLTDLSLLTVAYGFNPLQQRPTEFSFSGPLESGASRYYGTMGRCFNKEAENQSTTDNLRFRQGKVWYRINEPLYSTTDLANRVVNSSPFVSNPTNCANMSGIDLTKQANLSDIRYFINDYNEDTHICDPNTESQCNIKFTYFTDDFFPSITPYYSSDGGISYHQLNDICPNVPTGEFVVSELLCDFTDKPGTYKFQLRKDNYDATQPAVVIAESQELEILNITPISPVLSVPGPIIDVGFYTVSWSASASATRYVLEESIDATNWSTVYDGSNLDVLINGKWANNVTYYYRVQACNSTNCSSFSPVSHVTVVFNCNSASSVPGVPEKGDFIQEMESSVASLNRTNFSNKSVIPELEGIKIPETYILGVPNEKINILNASVTYEYNDVVIPGSNGLDLIVKRELGEFQMVSKVQGFKVEYCSGATINDRLSVFIEGKSLISVGFASSADVPTGTLVAYREGYFLRCNQQNKPEVISSDGKTYTFGKTLDNGTVIPPYNYFVTEIKDVFNNTITFNYGDNYSYICHSILNLESMSRNDGAQIYFEHELHNSLPFISKITYGNREVSYSYDYIQTWKMTSYLDQENRETLYEYYPIQPLLKKVTMPSGLNVEYEYALLDPDLGYNNELTHRIISGPDIPTNSISYVYGQGDVNYTNLLITQRFGNDYALIRRIAFRDSGLINPDANNELHSDYVLIGTIKSDTYLYDDDPVSLTNPLEVLYSETNLWSPYRFGGVGCPQINDAPVGGTIDYFRICARPLLLKKTFAYQVKEGITNTYDTYINDYINYDKYGYPSITKQSKVNSTTTNRYIKQSYNHDTQNWILGQPTITQVSSDNVNWTETTKNSYWPATSSYKSKLKYQYQYGQLNKYYQQYSTSGDLQRVNTSGTNYYETYSSYKRGIAQTATTPKRYTTGTQSRYKTVNDFGEIVSETDYIGVTTDYTYDDLGRLKLIDYNECDMAANCTYQNDVFTYSDSPNITTKTKGNYRETKTYDVLGRIKLESTQDLTDSTTKVSNSYTYGINGTLDYQSLPTNAINATGGNGIEYQYDFLNRKTRETVFDSSRITIRDFEYLKDNKVRLTDGNGYQTTIEYLSYGSSTYSNPVNISQQVTSTPTYVTTAINYNLFDNISTITQGGITETRLYDSYQQLCKVRRPDVGVTSYGYYSSGFLNWQANGTTGDTNDCLGVTASDKITYTYNNQNEPWTKSDANGVIQTNTTILVNNTGSVTQLDNNDTHLTLSYNKRNQLVSKAMDATPFNSISAGDGTTSWTYDDMGYTSTMSYPESDSMLTYSNNALGQVTAITESNNGADYFNISNINYHPSGGLLGYTLGNGITRTIARTNSGLSLNIVDTKATNTLFSHSYAYDNESNLSSLTDGVNSAYNLSAITYDGLNRLKTLTGNWGASNFNYDKLSNITQMKLGSQTLDYVYGVTNNRLESTTGSAQFSFQYDSSGNVTNNGFRGFDYDKQNRLISSQDVSFTHDGEDLIHSKSVIGEPTKYSLYGAGQDILFKFDSDRYGTVYYYLNDSSVANVKISSSGRELSYQHNDALGSLAVESDSSGTVIKTYHYEPYGFTLEAGQEDSPGYTGQIYDDDLGLNYMKARYYDPMIGRFYSNDPIGFDTSNPMMFNRYAYANNNPYRFTDPSGMCSKDNSGSEILCDIQDKLTEIIEPIIVDLFESTGTEIVTDPDDENSYEAEDTSIFGEMSAIVVLAVEAKLRSGKKGKKGRGNRCCFVAGTQVLSKDGYKNIEEIKLGELLWAKNIETGESDWKPVSKIYVENDRGIYHIRLKKSDGNIINIEATDDHPFYVADFGWKTTVELQVGDNIETKEAGHVVVVSVEDEHREDITYNFEIADFHTYYVSEFGVLVHNGRNCNKNKTGSSNAEKHGDSGRAMEKAKTRNAELQKQLDTAVGKTEKNKIRKKMQNNIKDAQKKRSGINDNNTGVRK